MSDLELAFAVHADEALALANGTFDVAAEVRLRECVWPDCLNAKQRRRLAEEIEYVKIHGEQHPDEDLTDQRTVCHCVDSGHGEQSGEEPPW